jgi:hypothetical protein
VFGTVRRQPRHAVPGQSSRPDENPRAAGTLADMDENRARHVTDALRDRGIAAHLRKSGIDAYSVQVPAGQGREAIWGAEGTTGLEAEVLLDGDLVGFVPQIPGSENFDEAQIVDAIARADYNQPVGRERDEAPPPGQPLAHEAGYSAASSTASGTTPRRYPRVPA